LRFRKLAGLCLFCAATAAAPNASLADMTSKSPPDGGESGRVTGTRLAEYYGALEQRLVARGALKTDPRAPGRRWGTEALARNFLDIAMFSEYAGTSTVTGSNPTAGTLRRWTVPVGVRVVFGSSVPPAQRERDLKAIRHYASDLSRYTGHPVGLTAGPGNLNVLVLSEAEIRGIDRLISRLLPKADRGIAHAIRSARPSILCMVVAKPHRERSRGYRNAVILVRAEHPARLRSSCIQEEMAQAMGLPNDSDRAQPSIFNDNEEYGVLTLHDRALLGMLYDPRLKPGMTLPEVRRLAPHIAASAIQRVAR